MGKLTAEQVEELLAVKESTIIELQQENRRFRAALHTLDADMHSTSTRPCGTCREVTKAVGKPFGCVKRDRG